MGLGFYGSARGIWAEDLGSLNGTHNAAKLPLKGPQLLASGEILELGRSRLRVTDPRHHSLNPTLALRGDLLGLSPLRSGGVAAFLVAVLVLMDSFAQWAGTFNRAAWSDLLSKSLSSATLALVWALLWALAGLVARREGSFSFQLTLSSLCLMGVTLMDWACCHLLYALGAPASVEAWYSFLMVFPFCLLIWFQLREALSMGRAHALRVSLGLSALVWLFMAVQQLQEAGGFKATPAICNCVSPMPLRLVADRELKKFLHESQTIFDIDVEGDKKI